MNRAAPTPPPIALSILKTGYAWPCWHPVARAEDIGAAPVKAVLLDEQLVIYRIKGQVVVARDVCPHRGVPLTLGFHDEEGSFVPITACASGRWPLQPHSLKPRSAGTGEA